MRRDRVAVLLAAITLAGVLGAGVGEASFAAATGFSGRTGFTCLSCHLPPPADVPEATVHLEGLPAMWVPETTHTLTVRVEGGPPAIPAGAPQGGFELEASAGVFAIPPSMDGLLRQPRDTQMTYTPDGTLMREWQVGWKAPPQGSVPEDTTFWVSAVAANGNHNIALNTSDGGEQGDRVASAVLVVPPSDGVRSAWVERPLFSPRIEEQGGSLLLRQEDEAATRFAWHWGDGEWQREEAKELKLKAAGHDGETLTVRSEEPWGRVSPEVSFHVGEARDTPAMTPLYFGGLLFIAVLLRRS